MCGEILEGRDAEEEDRRISKELIHNLMNMDLGRRPEYGEKEDRRSVHGVFERDMGENGIGAMIDMARERKRQVSHMAPARRKL